MSRIRVRRGQTAPPVGQFPPEVEFVVARRAINLAMEDPVLGLSGFQSRPGLPPAGFAFHRSLHSGPGRMRRMKRSNEGTVKAVSPRAALQTMPFAIN